MSSYSIVVENKDYEVDGSTKTYETVCQVKQTKGDLSSLENHYRIEFYDPFLLGKIYKDGEFYDKAEDVPA
tara:strand:- start:58 stop:270 length:213 start_codon:yes stop_codon:yes gene_type:complete